MTASRFWLKFDRQIIASSEILKAPFESIVMKGIGFPEFSILKIR